MADDTGVCFIPRDMVLEVVDAAEQKAQAEAIRCKAIDDGVPVPDIALGTTRPTVSPRKRRSQRPRAARGDSARQVPLFAVGFATEAILVAVCMWPSQRLAKGDEMSNWSSTRATM